MPSLHSSASTSASRAAATTTAPSAGLSSAAGPHCRTSRPCSAPTPQLDAFECSPSSSHSKQCTGPVPLADALLSQPTPASMHLVQCHLRHSGSYSKVHPVTSRYTEAASSPFQFHEEHEPLISAYCFCSRSQYWTGTAHSSAPLQSGTPHERCHQRPYTPPQGDQDLRLQLPRAAQGSPGPRQSPSARQHMLYPAQRCRRSVQ